MQRTSIFLGALILLATVTAQMQAAAKSDTRQRHHQYRLYDFGTIGGANTLAFNGPPDFGNLNSAGAAVGFSSTLLSDPYSTCWMFDCFVYHAVRYKDSSLRDLGALPGVNSSVGVAVNDLGTVVGISENGSVDPLTGYPETRAVVWGRGGITDLGTFGGNVSVASSINSQNQVVGAAANRVPDPYSSGLGPCFTYSCWPVATELRASLWSDGRMRDLGTLGGNDAAASLINSRGQITERVPTSTPLRTALPDCRRKTRSSGMAGEWLTLEHWEEHSAIPGG